MAKTRWNVLLAVDQLIEAEGVSPTFTEIATLLGKMQGYLSKSVVAYHVNKLVEQGYLERRPRLHRDLRLTTEGRQKIDQINPKTTAIDPP